MKDIVGRMLADAGSITDSEKTEFLTSFFDKLSDGILVTNYEGIIIFYNSALEELEFRSRENMLGRYIWDAYEYENIEESEHRHVLETGKSIINKYSAHSIVNDVPHFISYSSYPIELNGNRIGVYSICKSEESLHKMLQETVEVKRAYVSDSETNSQRKYYDNGTIYNFSDIVGNSEEMKKLINEAQAISWLDNSILIEGETGTGKEVLAQSIHNYAKRSNEPFIGLNCSAIPETLIESILFGTVKGAFTGAMDSAGLMEEAGEGTLFLDEINTMPLSMQAKLLRALQEKRVTRVGSTKSYGIKCRIISATNEDPFKLIESGKMRDDLFYRIAGYYLKIPALRDRKEDIITLTEHFIRRYGSIMGKSAVGVDRKLKKILDNYPWPGNIRELENLVENMLVLSENWDKFLTVNHIPEYIKKRFLGPKDLEKDRKFSLLNDELDDLEKKIILKSLEDNGWNYTKTSEALGIIRQSLAYRMKRLNIKK